MRLRNGDFKIQVGRERSGHDISENLKTRQAPNHLNWDGSTVAGLGKARSGCHSRGPARADESSTSPPGEANDRTGDASPTHPEELGDGRGASGPTQCQTRRKQRAVRQGRGKRRVTRRKRVIIRPGERRPMTWRRDDRLAKKKQATENRRTWLQAQLAALAEEASGGKDSWQHRT